MSRKQWILVLVGCGLLFLTLQTTFNCGFFFNKSHSHEEIHTTITDGEVHTTRDKDAYSFGIGEETEFKTKFGIPDWVDYEGGEVPHPNADHPCLEKVGDDRFAVVLTEIEAKSDEAEQLRFAKLYFLGKCIRTDQTIEIMHRLLSEESRLDFAWWTHNMTIDPEQYERVREGFSQPELSVAKLDKKIAADQSTAEEKELAKSVEP